MPKKHWIFWGLPNELLISRLQGEAKRKAHYVCVLIGVKSADDPDPLVATGYWHGEIVDTPRGENGFGYDPYFFLPQEGKTAAELSEEEKNSVSHRGQAVQGLLSLLRNHWGW